MYSTKKRRRQYYQKNKEKIKERSRKRREANPNMCKEYCKQWRLNNPEYDKQYYQKNKEKRKAYDKQYKKDNVEKIKERSKKYYLENIDKIKEYDKKRHGKNRNKDKTQHKLWVKNNPNYYKEYYHKNIEKIRKRSRESQEYHNQYKKKKRKINPKFKLDGNIGWMIWHGLKKEKGNKRWVTLVDYSIDDLMKHLEKQFTSKMNWENYGNYWVVDHIIPRKVFNYTKPEHIDFKRCWALSNLQPLPVKENSKKGSNLLKPFQPTLKI